MTNMTDQERLAYAERILAAGNADGSINDEVLKELIAEGTPSAEDQAAILNLVVDLYNANQESSDEQQEEAESDEDCYEVGAAEARPEAGENEEQ